MTPFLETPLEDGRRAVAALWRSPKFTVCVLALVTITIGAMTAIGAAAYELLNGPLPYGSPEQLVMVWSDLPDSNYVRAPLSGPEVNDLREQAHTLAAVGAIFPYTATLNDPMNPAQISTGTVTANFFEILRVGPKLGRVFTVEDEGAGKPPTIVLGWNLWQQRFGSDPSIIGKMIMVNNQQTEVIGVMPDGLRLAFPPDANVPSTLEAWLPLAPELKKNPRRRFFLRVIARLRETTTVAAASDEMRALGETLKKSYPQAYARSGRAFSVVGLAKDLAQSVRVSAATQLSGAVLLVLLAYVNLSGLWIARTVAQRNDDLIRQALGASAGRMWRQVLIQATVLSVVGSLLGLAAGALGLMGLRVIRPPSLARIDYATVTAPVILGVVGLVVISTLFLAFVAHAGVTPLTGSEFSRMRVASGPRYKVRAGLVVAQMALAFVFLVSSALWIRTTLNVLNTDPGFRPDHALTFRYSLDPLALQSDAEKSQFIRRLAEAISTLPDVTAAGHISHVPYDRLPNWSMQYRAHDSVEGTDRAADVRPVSPGLAGAMGVRLRAGRFFTDADNQTAPAAVVVDRTLAERTWPGADAVGKQLRVATFAGGPPSVMTVVGVVEHVRYRAIEMQVREQLYLPALQIPWGPCAFVVRSTGDPRRLMGAIRDRVRQVDGRVPVWDVRPLPEYYADATAERRLTAGLLGSFAFAALALVSIGVYGLLAYVVESRRSEIGVRLALGARSGQVARTVVREALQWAVVGVVIGGVTLFLAGGSMSTALYGVTPRDLLSWGVAGGILFLFVVTASWGPALRASRTDPTMLMKS